MLSNQISKILLLLLLISPADSQPAPFPCYDDGLCPDFSPPLLVTPASVSSTCTQPLSISNPSEFHSGSFTHFLICVFFSCRAFALSFLKATPDFKIINTYPTERSLLNSNPHIKLSTSHLHLHILKGFWNVKYPKLNSVPPPKFFSP